MGRSEKDALYSHLVNLFLHIIKWYSQPSKRTRSWYESINNSRQKISSLLDKHPSFRLLIDVFIPESFEEGTKRAEKEMGIKSTKKSVSKKELFDDKYDLEE